MTRRYHRIWSTRGICRVHFTERMDPLSSQSLDRSGRCAMESRIAITSGPASGLRHVPTIDGRQRPINSAGVQRRLCGFPGFSFPNICGSGAGLKVLIMAALPWIRTCHPAHTTLATRRRQSHVLVGKDHRYVGGGMLIVQSVGIHGIGGHPASNKRFARAGSIRMRSRCMSVRGRTSSNSTIALSSAAARSRYCSSMCLRMRIKSR